jgi:hypothetical protein
VYPRRTTLKSGCLHFADEGAIIIIINGVVTWAALLLYLLLVRLAPYVFSSRLFAYNGNVCV